MPEAAQKAPAPAPGSTPGSREDPIRNYLWEIQLGGIPAGQFAQCSGLEVQVDPISYWEGGDLVERLVPGRVTHARVRLQKGITQASSSALWSWMKSVVSTPPVQRQTVMLRLLDTNGVSAKMNWVLYEAWPCAFRVEPLDAGSSTWAVHSMDIAYERLEQQTT